MAITSPFARINADLPPLAPDPTRGPFVFAPTGPEEMAAPKPIQQAAASPVWAPSAPQNSEMQDISGRLEQDYNKDRNPYGSPNNHPGFWGKLAHGLNVATGGVNRRGWEEMGLQKRLNELLNDESKQSLEGAEAGNQTATAAHTNAETPEVAPNAKSARDLQAAQAGNLRSETNVREHPQSSWKALPSVSGPNGEPVEIEEHTGQFRFGDLGGMQPSKEPKPDTPEQQFIDEHMKSHPGSTVAQAIKAYTDTTQRPPQAIMLVPGANGGYTAQNIRPGSNVALGAMTTSGASSLNVPDSSTRSMVANAPGVLDLASRVNQLIDQQVQQLGPGAGRWNDFWTGKVGAPNPQFKALMTDVKLLKTKLMRMHVGARGGEYIMKSFDDMLDAGKDSPENLKAALTEITNYARDLQNEEKTGQLAPGTQHPDSGNAPPPGAKIIDFTNLGGTKK